MRKLMIAAVVAAATSATAPSAQAYDRPPGPCEVVATTFETANVQWDDVSPEAGAVWYAFCSVNG
jgi:hypothetical protein